jgi:uncharacterized membrane protein YuzA (DUF378 family)
MLRQAAAPVGLLVVGIVVLIAGGGSTATEAIAFALIGIACVVALSLVFLAVGRSEDEQRAAEAAAREPQPPPADPHTPPAHEEARKRRRPMPPRRPN